MSHRYIQALEIQQQKLEDEVLAARHPLKVEQVNALSIEQIQLTKRQQVIVSAWEAFQPVLSQIPYVRLSSSSTKLEVLLMCDLNEEDVIRALLDSTPYLCTYLPDYSSCVLYVRIGIAK